MSFTDSDRRNPKLPLANVTILGPEILVICNINTGTTLSLPVSL